MCFFLAHNKLAKVPTRSHCCEFHSPPVPVTDGIAAAAGVLMPIIAVGPAPPPASR